MDGIILLDTLMQPIQYLPICEGDFNNGDTFDFEIKIPKTVNVDYGYYVAIENSEFGGIVDSIKTDTSKDYVTIGGRTWYGILQGLYNVSDYATANTDNLITSLSFMLERRVPDFFAYGDDVAISKQDVVYRSTIYVLSAIRETLRRFGKRIHIRFDNILMKPVIEVKDITKYGAVTELKDNFHYSFKHGKPYNMAVTTCNGKTLYAYLDENSGNITCSSSYRYGKQYKAVIKESTNDDESEASNLLVEALVDEYVNMNEVEIYDVDSNQFYLDDEFVFTADGNTYSAYVSSKSAIIQDGKIQYEIQTSNKTS